MGKSAFWQFSLALYAQPGVADACLHLQDHAGVDVNVLFYLLFLASRGRVVERLEAQQIEETAAAWREAVVAPLREIRRKLKMPVGAFAPTLTSALRSDIKRIELAAERIQQERLEQMFPLLSDESKAMEPNAAARANLAAYRGPLGPLPAQSLAVVMHAFTQTSCAKVRS
jgi:uncharacterized protein (TIGR02444 family)